MGSSTAAKSSTVGRRTATVNMKLGIGLRVTTRVRAERKAWPFLSKHGLARRRLQRRGTSMYPDALDGERSTLSIVLSAMTTGTG